MAAPDQTGKGKAGSVPGMVALTVLGALLAASPVAAQVSLEGAWVGWAEGESVPMEVRLEVGPDGPDRSAWVSVPHEGLMDLEAERVEVTDDSLSVVLPGDMAEVRTSTAADRLEGVLDWPTGELDVVFVRPESAEADEMESQARRAVQGLRDRPLERTVTGLDEGVDAAALQRLVTEAEEANSTALVVLHNGEPVGEWHVDGESRLLESMSVTKVALNLAAGRLHTQGRLESLDFPVHRVYPEWSDGARAEVTVRHLLTHTSGLASPQPATPIYESGDFVRFALESPLEEEPGSTFRYNNSATNLLAGFLGELAGESLDDFLREDLFAALGITDFEWTRDDAGQPHGMAGLRVHPRDLARLGQLALQRGEWEGERLIDEEWFRMSLTPGGPHSHQVGLLWWLLWEEGAEGEGEPSGFMHSGHLGQFLVVDREHRLVGVRLVEPSPAYNAETDAFQDFPDRLRSLVSEDGAGS